MIRRAEERDAGNLARICGEGLGYPTEERDLRERFRGLDPAREEVFAAFEGDLAVGFIHVERYALLYSEPMANILGLAVLPSCQGKGYGRELMEAAEGWARERGIREMRLNSGGSRHGAHAFYRHLGFDDEKVQLRFIKVLA